MSREADFSQFEQFAKAWQAVDKDFDIFLRQFLLEMALSAIAKIKPKTPEDTGALRNTWGVGNQALQVGRQTGEALSAFEQAATLESVEMVGDSIQIAIWNLMDYASFIEYGHRLVNGAWQDGYFMMTVSIDEIQRQIPARFNKAFKQYIASKGAV